VVHYANSVSEGVLNVKVRFARATLHEFGYLLAVMDSTLLVTL
jgi:hypothetical protein